MAVIKGEYCLICGREKEATHHLIFGMGRRELCDQDKIFIPICNQCHTLGHVTNRIHDNSMAERLSKMLGQALWENKYIKEKGDGNEREEFIKRYGINYL